MQTNVWAHIPIILFWQYLIIDFHLEILFILFFWCKEGFLPITCILQKNIREKKKKREPEDLKRLLEKEINYTLLQNTFFSPIPSYIVYFLL